MKQNIDVYGLSCLLGCCDINANVSDEFFNNLCVLIGEYIDSDEDVVEIVSKINAIDMINCLE